MSLISVRKPPVERLRRFLTEQAAYDFHYDSVGATASTPPAGYVVDRTCVELGSGESVYRTAQAALRRWEQFELGWVAAWSPDTPLEAGRVVAILGRSLGCWFLNACRIVYAVDEPAPRARFGFAYGTLPGHVESGEERFLIEWDAATDRVVFDILAFSRPNHPLTRLGYPLVRRRQKQFGRESATAMYRAVHGPGAKPLDIRQSTG